MPAERSRLAIPLWLTVAAAALPSLLYQSSGYIQFGYRYSLDYMVFLMMILAVGNRPLSRVFKGLVVVAFAINLFLAITFDRYMEFSYDDAFFPHGANN
jgi:peptidoglycan/LPS O-acetylase OafA/YrhL